MTPKPQQQPNNIGNDAHLKYNTESYTASHLPTLQQHRKYKSISKAHVDGFNFLINTGLHKAVADLQPVYYQNLQFSFENPHLTVPTLTPAECRVRGVHYQSQLTADIVIQTSNGSTLKLKRRLGHMPLMVQSSLCHLSRLNPNKLVAQNEDSCEFGGYFIINGAERMIRLLQVPRRNFGLAIVRSSFKKRGNMYTDKGIMIRCARYSGCQSTITNTLHYLEGGMATLRVSVRKQEFLLPVNILLKCLGGNGNVTDEEIHDHILSLCRTQEMREMYRPLVLLLTQPSDSSGKNAGLNTTEECKLFLGSRFRIVLDPMGVISSDMSDIDVADIVLDQFILPMTNNNEHKLSAFYLLLHKLYSFVLGLCQPDSGDALSMQEILLPGHLLTTFMKEKMQEALASIPSVIRAMMRKNVLKEEAVLSESQDAKLITSILDRTAMSTVANKMASFLSTGNLVSSTGLDQMQISGYTIVAERLNFLRFLSHFRSVHRGQFFTTMRTTAIRKLLPDQWGFLCCVHTPDGGPCGLLSHLTSAAIVRADDVDSNEVNKVLGALVNMFGARTAFTTSTAKTGKGNKSSNELVSVVMDGIPRLALAASKLEEAAMYLRKRKCAGTLLEDLEVATISTSESAYPGLFLHTQAARMSRPVLNLQTQKIEMIGPMEQPYLMIGVTGTTVDNHTVSGHNYTHEEVDPLAHLSIIASMTPFSDMNQSPRNMYQCQMGKQTMGTPIHNLYGRTDNKMYKLHNPQCPLVRTNLHTDYKMDEYPNGTNAVVAVISYTGYDMEDAMILNKCSYERGFGHASVYKSKIVDLEVEGKNKGKGADALKFSNPVVVKKSRDGSERSTAEFKYPQLDADGLPRVGETLKQDDVLYCIVNPEDDNDAITGKHKEIEPATIQSVRLLGPTPTDPVGKSGGSAACKRVALTLRVNRNPVIGDKFSSRHGQKGVMSVLYPQIDMPFTESGLTPDVIINPHAFPSRMTIGMLVESMAGKAGAMHGNFQNGTPFQFHETEGDGQLAVDYFGQQLQSAGYSYHGSEPIYSGHSGQLLQADLYIGVVYYQRLRHMVSDKSQVRATGQVNQLTRQPIKGRKKGGGVRLGEMERDALLSHGAAFCLHDRLLNCSDRHVALVCRRCGDLLSPCTERSSILSAGQSVVDAQHNAKLRVYCKNADCIVAASGSFDGSGNNADDDHVEPIVLPYVYRYLANELAAMNIKMKMDVQ